MNSNKAERRKLNTAGQTAFQPTGSPRRVLSSLQLRGLCKDRRAQINFLGPPRSKPQGPCEMWSLIFRPPSARSS